MESIEKGKDESEIDENDTQTNEFEDKNDSAKNDSDLVETEAQNGVFTPSSIEVETISTHHDGKIVRGQKVVEHKLCGCVTVALGFRHLKNPKAVSFTLNPLYDVALEIDLDNLHKEKSEKFAPILNMLNEWNVAEEKGNYLAGVFSGIKRTNH